MSGSKTIEIAGYIRNDILKGHYSTGDRLQAERELAAKYDAHRSSVREALKILEQEGLIYNSRGSCPRVQALHKASTNLLPYLLFRDEVPNLDLFRQMFEVLDLLVTNAIELALKNGSAEQISQAVEMVEELISDNIQDRHAIINRLLALIVESTNNIVLKLMYNAIDPTLHERLGTYLNRIPWGYSEHAGVMIGILKNAIANRDIQTAVFTAKQMIQYRQSYVLEFMQSDLRQKEEGTLEAGVAG